MSDLQRAQSLGRRRKRAMVINAFEVSLGVQVTLSSNIGIALNATIELALAFKFWLSSCGP